MAGIDAWCITMHVPSLATEQMLSMDREKATCQYCNATALFQGMQDAYKTSISALKPLRGTNLTPAHEGGSARMCPL